MAVSDRVEAKLSDVSRGASSVDRRLRVPRFGLTPFASARIDACESGRCICFALARGASRAAPRGRGGPV
ncbi:hypothetical protein C5615_12455 [Burkholderia cepacia]|uniref:Uncharacterized protein n=1 Tax=Burkholderia cepacia TaxID=292 RepID=A0A2S8IV58_BURCE|nr:hypothetical protein JM78_07310 [Burkholderia pyrrocinia]PQP18650.1 hypothetical protein C5615_12455 [Burkholderia cepacia]